MRHRRHRYQRRFVRIVLSTVVTAVLGIGAVSLGGSSDKPATGTAVPGATTNVPGATTNTPQDQISQVQQLTRDLQGH